VAGQLDNALAECEAAIKLDATYLRSFIHRGYIYYKMGKFDNAMNDCTLVIDKDPESFPDLYYVR
jgi:tetratricopeptide (TPR) repeat protein